MRAVRYRVVAGLAFFGGLAVAGCTRPAEPSPPVALWAKPNATYNDYLKDRYACILDARTQVSSGYVYEGSGALNSGQVISKQVAIACMAAQGWVESPTGFAPPAGGGVLAR